MLSDVVSYLRCPHCAATVSLEGRGLSCTTGHTFDVARQGYVSLLRGDAPGDAGDTAAMVRARQEVLAAGHFARLAERVASVAADVRAPGCVVDAGGGTGYYLAAVLDRLDGRVGLALDISKHASRRAARAHPRAGAVTCDVWRRLPVADGVAALVLDVFAPRNGAEFRRVLGHDGVLAVVTPTGRHLHELVDALGLLTVDARKDDRVAGALGDHFTQAESWEHEEPLTLTHAEAVAVAGMGPSAWHTTPDELRARVAGLPDPVTATLSVTVATYRPRQAAGRSVKHQRPPGRRPTP